MKQLLATLAVITLMFSCKKKDSLPPPTPPLVTTAALSNVNVGAGTATAGGSIVSDGGAIVTKSGIVWSKTNATPTLTDSMVSGSTANGAFTNNIVGLDFGNTYYFRAFATNSVGTGYGSVVTLTTSNDSVRFTYNGQTVTYGIIVSPTTGKKWLDRNIGAKRQATAFDDYQAYGDFFQWGRPADGHQLINWTSSSTRTAVNGTTTTLATSDVPGHSNFIVYVYPGTGDYVGDWRDNDNSSRWFTNPQGPCPAGWHVPTIAEWRAEISASGGGGGTATSGGFSERLSAFTLLKLTVAGARKRDGTFGIFVGSPGTAGSGGTYWSSTYEGNYRSNYFDFTDLGVESVPGGLKTEGKSVRCIKD